MAEHQRPVANTQCAGRTDVFEIARPQEFGPHHADQRGPTERNEDEEHHPDRWRQDRNDDQDDEKLWHRGPNFLDTLKCQVDPATEEALRRARKHANQRRDDRDRETEQDRQAEPIDNACQHVTSLSVRTKPMVSVRGGWGRIHVVVDGVVSIGNNRPGNRPFVCRVHPVRVFTSVQHFQKIFRNIEARIQPASSDQALHRRVAIVGFGIEIATERRFRIELRDWRKAFALVADHQRFVVCHDLGKQADHEQHQEDPQRPERPAVGAEVA